MDLLELIENKNKNKRSKEDKIVKSRIQGINKDKKQTNNFCIGLGVGIWCLSPLSTIVQCRKSLKNFIT
jgi:hypothetical protein